MLKFMDEENTLIGEDAFTCFMKHVYTPGKIITVEKENTDEQGSSGQSSDEITMQSIYENPTKWFLYYIKKVNKKNSLNYFKTYLYVQINRNI